MADYTSLTESVNAGLSGARQSPACTTLLSIPGVGLLTATAMVAATSGKVSHFHDARHFASWFGLTPKELGRVSRFLHALRILSSGHRGSLTEVALASGFFDQAHFNHEFQELAGMRPGELLTFPNVSF